MSADDRHAHCLLEDRTEDAPQGSSIIDEVEDRVLKAFAVIPKYRWANEHVDSEWVCDTVERLFTAIHAQPTPGLRYTAVEAALRALLHRLAWPEGCCQPAPPPVPRTPVHLPEEDAQ